ncbi:hypothetical protein Drorol1_Dr00010140 [Drosera rotundifolia]
MERTLLSTLTYLFALISSQENQTDVVYTQSFMDVVTDECRIAGDYTQLDAHEFLLKLLIEVAKTVKKDSVAIGLKGFQVTHQDRNLTAISYCNGVGESSMTCFFKSSCRMPMSFCSNC